MRFFAYLESPLSRIMLTSDGSSLTGVFLEGQRYEPAPQTDWILDDSLPLFRAVATQLSEYFVAKRTVFDLPLSPAGTPFQRDVWKHLQSIPYGQRISYGSIARALGRANATRAVGAAIGRNPISIIIPCHRVVGKNGALTGYAGGLDRKKMLLELETSAAPGLCPLCGQPNNCGALKGEPDCWCRDAVIPQDVLDRVPTHLRGVACVCRACARLKRLTDGTRPGGGPGGTVNPV